MFVVRIFPFSVCERYTVVMQNPLGRFAAIDFETADYGRDSACSLAIVVVEGTTVVQQGYFLIRPPRRQIHFTYIHGIRWVDVASSPSFAEMWPAASQLLTGVEFIAAHNASFDRSVLHTCCLNAGLPLTPLPFYCTVKIARKAWSLRPANLPAVCRHLGLPLKHHDAASDALACAGIVIAAREQGHAVFGQMGAYRGSMAAATTLPLPTRHETQRRTGGPVPLPDNTPGSDVLAVNEVVDQLEKK